MLANPNSQALVTNCELERNIDITYTLEGGLGSGVGLLGALGGSYIIIRISNRSYSELAKSAAA